MNNGVYTFQHVRRNGSHIAKVLQVKEAFRKHERIVDANAEVPRIQTHKKGIR
jgi:hypothetical protein